MSFGGSVFGGGAAATPPSAANASPFGGGGLTPSGGLFGGGGAVGGGNAFQQQSQPAQSLFGNPTPALGGNTSTFGSTPSLFGQPATQQQQPQQQQAAPANDQNLPPSTRVVKWAISQLNDSGLPAADGGRYLAVSLMDTFRDFSFEELRFGDYARGDKGGETPPAGLQQQQQQPFGAQPQQPGGLFAQPQQTQSTGLAFGSAPAFGGGSGGLFGQSAAAVTTSFGGANASTSGGLFGGSAASSQSLFGAAPQSQSLFGGAQPQSQSLFGGGAVVASPQSQSLFGGGASLTNPQSQSLFGGSATLGQQPSFFGNPPQQQQQPQPQANTSLFTQTPAGQQASIPSLFGAAQNAASAPSLFGTQQSTPSLFAAPQQASGGLFGSTFTNPASSSGALLSAGSAPSLFGSFQPQQAQSSSSLFGNPASGGSLFGGSFTQPGNASSTPGLFNFNSAAATTPGGGLGGITPSGGGLFGSAFGNPQQVQQQPVQLSLTSDPFGQSRLISGASTAAGLTSTSAHTTSQSQPSLSVVVANPTSTLPSMQSIATTATARRARHSAKPDAAALVRRGNGHGWFSASPMRPWGRDGSLFNADALAGQGHHHGVGRPLSMPVFNLLAGAAGGANGTVGPGALIAGAFPAPWRTEQQMLRAANIKKLVIEPVTDDPHSRTRHMSFRLGRQENDDDDDVIDVDRDDERENHDDGMIPNDEYAEQTQVKPAFPRMLIEKRATRMERERYSRRQTDADSLRDHDDDDRDQRHATNSNVGDDVEVIGDPRMDGDDGLEDAGRRRNTNAASDNADDDVVEVPPHAGSTNGVQSVNGSRSMPDKGRDGDNLGSAKPTSSAIVDEGALVKREDASGVNIDNSRLVPYSEVYRKHFSAANRRVSIGDQRLTITPAAAATTPAAVPTSTPVPNEPSPSTIAPICRRVDAYTEPPLDQLRTMSDAQLSAVQDFSYGVHDVGRVTWPGATDVRNMDLDKVIRMKRREIVVYPDGVALPPQGTQLNKQAVVQLHGIWKYEKRSNVPLKDAAATANIVARLKKHCDREGLTFLGYDVRTGTWSFRAEHF